LRVSSLNVALSCGQVVKSDREFYSVS
jgi:hypothetical protein